MNGKRSHSITRREFARRAASAAAASLIPSAASPSPAGSLATSIEQSQALPPDSAEAEARYRTILNLYESRFTDAQKAELHRLCASSQPMLDRLRGYAVENGDDPALFLKPLIEHERKPEVSNVSRSAEPAPRS